MTADTIRLHGGEYLGLRAAAAAYSVGESTIRAKVAAGDLPALRQGRKLFLAAADIEAALFTEVKPKGKP